MRALAAGATYCLGVFAAGCALGPLRERAIVPAVGETVAFAVELPLMLIVSVLVARWVCRRDAVPAAIAARVIMGVVALVLLLLAEIAGSVWLRGLSSGAALARYATLPGALSLAAFAVFAAIPALIAERR